MIPKVTRGRSLGGLMGYLVDTDQERTANVHTEPHLVAGDPAVMAWYGDGELSKADGYAIAKVLDEPRRSFMVDVPKGHVWHCSLSLRADEGRLARIHKE